MRCVKSNRTLTREQVRQQCCPHVCIRTFNQYLHENGLQTWIAKKRPKLNPRTHCQKTCLGTREERLVSGSAESTIWSDECSIEKSTDARQIWVFRTPEAKWEKNCIAAVEKENGISIMVWGCVRGKQKGTFVPFVVKSVKAPVYLRLRELLVLPVIQHFNSTIGGARFQQDNAPVYKAKIIADFFDLHKVTVDNQPPYSPDLNPIEHVWVHLKRRLHKMYPNIAATPGGPGKVRARLIAVIPEVWDSLRESPKNCG